MMGHLILQIGVLLLLGIGITQLWHTHQNRLQSGRLMSALYTAIGTNNGLYLALGVVAHSKNEAQRLLMTEFESAAREDAQEIDADSGDTAMGYEIDAIKERVRDEAGDYINEEGSASEEISSTDADVMWANPGRVRMLASGSNG